MKQFSKQNGIAITSLLLALPAAFLIAAALLKYSSGINWPFDVAIPMLEKWGVKEAIGWNLNLLILTGPFISFLLTIFQVLKINICFTQNHFLFQCLLRKRWLLYWLLLLALA